MVFLYFFNSLICKSDRLFYRLILLTKQGGDHPKLVYRENEVFSEVENIYCEVNTFKTCFEFDSKYDRYLKGEYDLTDFKVGLKLEGKLVAKRIKGGTILKETTYEMR